SGGAVVVLKRLTDAQRDGDTVYAVIRGVGLNNDGAEKASFTAPSVSGQAASIRMALDHAGVSARDIGYVEAHGTATSLGDPIEIAALTRAYRPDTADTQFCGIGSLKGNLGHMVAAAGVAGLIKAALALHRERIPASINYTQPNPEIDFERSPFRVVAANEAWPRGEAARYAAVSSFGVGGTNAHVVMEEAPPRVVQAQTHTHAQAAEVQRAWRVFALSAHDAPGLQRRAAELASFVDAADVAGADALDLNAVAATLMRGRKAMPYRAAVVADDAPSLASQLRALKAPTSPAASPRLVFAFPGQGSQHPGMAREMYREFPAYREALDQCLAAMPESLRTDLRRWLLDCAPDDVEASAMLAQTRHAQPALFAVSYSLAMWLDSLGLHPAAMIGHSIGEYAAACVAGVFTLEDAITAVVARGRAMFECVPGSMLAVRESSDRIRPLLPADAEIAAYNAPALTVIAGSAQAIEAASRIFTEQNIGTVSLTVSHAFHSRSMEPALAQVRAALAACTLHAPHIPVYSCVSGEVLMDAEAMSAEYWSRQVRAPVQFSKAVLAELAHEATVIVEVGPSQALSSLIRMHRNAEGQAPRLCTLLGPAREPGDSVRSALAAVGNLWSLGAPVAWPVSATAPRQTLPGYPFQGERYWFARRVAPIEDTQSVHQAAASQIAEAGSVMSRRCAIEAELKNLFSSVSGISIDAIQAQSAFTDQGFDSLSLTQAALELDRVFGVKLRLRRLMDDLASVSALAAFLDEQLPADRFAQGTAQAQTSATTPATTPEPESPAIRALIDKPFGASARIVLDVDKQMTSSQLQWLREFTMAYNARTARSKSFSQQHRRLMADPRVVTGFNPVWKDLVYPIVVDSSQGARLKDIDGNEYIDVLSAFGANLLGYQPRCVSEAISQQMKAGFEVGPQHPLTADVAALVSEFTGMERVAFCNTGSEAVMGAMRIARTVTGRKTIAIFTNSYHGIFDEVIVRGTKQLRSLSAAPGILASAVENVLVLDYGSDEALKILRERGRELAAIMIEPIQNKYPTLHPVAFVRELRKIADESQCALIFDEVVTGFRVAPGGAQEFFGVRADIATYGKVIGGGLPFAVIAGSGQWMDALDGGYWQYGDDSYPEAGVTYFAGTFVRHPLALAAAHAVLLHLKASGRRFYDTLNGRTERLAGTLNREFAKRNAPVRAVHCASLWRLHWDDDLKYVGLFYYLLRFKGIHVYEQ
ncbi:MAG: aminotransferase class III-fold pyridoxal phosphate-dependent enzyme, partial [Nevskiaceae bacterium]|nr:aminotransferase class III-fold pyridoxal phosphate-dependent enzyme [Nevskiaceae bacterium]